MSITFIADAPASTDSVADFAANSADGPINSSGDASCEPVRHLLFGSLSAVRATIYYLHTLRYAEPNDWSQPISTGRPNEVMAILTRRVKLH